MKITATLEYHETKVEQTKNTKKKKKQTVYYLGSGPRLTGNRQEQRRRI